jgi:hypothetical protein
MQREEQVEQVGKLLAYLDARTTAMADGVYQNPVRDYTCPHQFAQERELFFRRSPLLIGLSCLLPMPGDYLTHDYSGIPLLLVRAAISLSDSGLKSPTLLLAGLAQPSSQTTPSGSTSHILAARMHSS